MAFHTNSERSAVAGLAAGCIAGGLALLTLLVLYTRMPELWTLPKDQHSGVIGTGVGGAIALGAGIGFLVAWAEITWQHWLERRTTLEDEDRASRDEQCPKCGRVKSEWQEEH